MFIGHLPAAYLLGCAIRKARPSMQLRSDAIVLATLIGGVLPDFDLVYFYTIDARQVVHHQYWSHIPFYWVVIFLCLSLITYLFQNMKAFKLLFFVFFAIMLHLALDTITGQIHWLYPFSTNTYSMVHVPAVHEWWVANFVLHWTFAVELLVVFFALTVYFKRKNT